MSIVVVVVIVIVIETLNWLYKLIDYENDNRFADNDNEGGLPKGHDPHFRDESHRGSTPRHVAKFSKSILYCGISSALLHTSAPPAKQQHHKPKLFRFREGLLLLDRNLYE